MQTIYSATLTYPYTPEPVVHLALDQDENLARLAEDHITEEWEDGVVNLTEDSIRDALEAQGMRVWFDEHWVPEV